MDILLIAHLLNALLMIALPVALVLILLHYWKLPARIWWIGVVTFILSQLFHIPFNWGFGIILNQTGIVAWSPTAQLLFNALFLGLSAGLFEELARYFVLRWWARDVRSWRRGILFGAGHGGAEAIILGALTFYSFIQLTAMRNADLSKILPVDQIALAQQQLHAYWSMPWTASLLGALERFLTIPTQIALAVMVLQVFTRNKKAWLFAAITYHAILDGVAVFGQHYLSAIQLEGVIGLFAVVSVLIVFFLRQPEPTEIIPPGQDLLISMIKPPELTDENLEKTRYQSL